MSGSAHTTAMLCRRVRERNDQAAFAELVRRNRVALSFIVHEFRWAQDGYVERGDLWQEALLGAWKAARDFKPHPRATYTSMAKVYARNEIRNLIAKARSEKRERDRAALSLDAESQDPKRFEDGDTLADTVPAPDYWDPEVMAQIRAELRFLSTELPQALSPVEREALARVMLDESNHGRSGSAMRRVRSKASRLLSYDWQPAHAPDVAQRRQRGLQLLAQGHTASEVARRVGVTDQTVRRWNTEAKAAA